MNLITKNFVKKAKLIHGDKFNYKQVNYVLAIQKVSIICSIHGEFLQTPNKHLSGQGCPYCAGKHKTLENTLDEFYKVHGNLYDYSLVKYKNVKTKVKIICKKHGVFDQLPSKHSGGAGCPKCYGRGKTNNEILNELKKIHSNSYTFNLDNRTNNSEKIEVHCKKHGIFKKTTSRLLRGEGCPSCSNESTASILSLSKNDFIKRSRLVHGNIYDYKEINYKNMKTKVSINCAIHGLFNQSPEVHLNGSICPSCVEHGFNPSIPAYVYILVTKDKKFIKVGLTNNIKSRLSKLTKNTPFAFEKLKEYRFAIGMNALLTEKKAHKLLKPAKFDGFDGSTEWFLYDHKIILFIKKQSQLHKDDKEPRKIITEKISAARIIRKEQFIKDASSTHGHKYDYSLVEYTNANTKIKIICPTHGVFEQNPYSHKNGIGCSRCSGYKKTNEDAVHDFKKHHGNKYDYSKVKYLNSKTKVTIICRTHGEFEQTPTSHLEGSGCLKCYLDK